MKKKKSTKSKKKGKHVVVVRGKRKESIARACVSEGKGSIRVNRFPVEALDQRYVKRLIMEPILLAGPVCNGLNIDVSVRGGGVMGQAQAARLAIARGIVAFTGDESLKKKFEAYDRHLMVEDFRRVEPKKYKGPKARARFQKSYR